MIKQGEAGLPTDWLIFKEANRTHFLTIQTWLMDNLFASAIVALLLVALLLFVILKNRKDKKEVEEDIKQNYPRPRHRSNDAENAEDSHT